MTSRNRTWVGAVLIGDRANGHGADRQRGRKPGNHLSFAGRTNSPNDVTQDSDFTDSRWFREPRHRVISSRVGLVPRLFFAEQPASLWLAATGVA